MYVLEVVHKVNGGPSTAVLQSCHLKFNQIFYPVWHLLRFIVEEVISELQEYYILTWVNYRLSLMFFS